MAGVPPVPPGPAAPVPGLAAFLASLTAALGPGLPHTLTGAAAGDDVYEAYLMARILRVAMGLGFGIGLEDTNGAPAAALQLRTSPGSIHNGPYTHAVLLQPAGTGEDLEVHTGVKVRGTSGAPHECDVLILKRGEGIACRAANRHPRSAKVVWAVEAKFYVVDNVGVDKAREYFGLNLEMSGQSGRRLTLVVTKSTPNVKRIFVRHTPTGHFYRGVYPGQVVERDFDAQMRQVLDRQMT
jgi:hypothetical protein